MLDIARLTSLACAAARVTHTIPHRQLSYLAISPHVMPTFTVSYTRLFEDNYCWHIHNPVHNLSLVVDPADAGPVIEHLRSKDGAELVAILTTHHHWDHAGGNEAMAKAYPGVKVVGGADDGAKIAAMTHAAADGEVMSMAELRVTALSTPCHTAGHVCYLVEGDDSTTPAVFTGDALFVAGCGRFFEGTAAQMLSSLDKLAALPPQTRVYCGHEYTLSNLKFCAHVEPDNVSIADKLRRVAMLTAAGEPTVPSTIAEELDTNVFMRTRQPSVHRFTHPDAPEGSHIDPIEVMAKLREAKNNFKSS